MSKFTATVKKEIHELIPPTVFFFIALGLISLIRSLMLKGTGIAVGSWLTVAVSALVLGKSVLIADLLPIINRFPTRPLIYNVVWKTLIYLVVATFVHYLERLYDYCREAGGLAAGNEKLLAEMVWAQFWAIHLVLCLLIFQYCAMHELGRVVGGGKLRRVFLGPVQDLQR